MPPQSPDKIASLLRGAGECDACSANVPELLTRRFFTLPSPERVTVNKTFVVPSATLYVASRIARYGSRCRGDDRGRRIRVIGASFFAVAYRVARYAVEAVRPADLTRNIADVRECLLPDGEAPPFSET